jgi:hypothetical protein
MRQRLFISPSNPDIIGKVKPEAEHIHVVAICPYAMTLQLPDVGTSENVEIIVYNLLESVGILTVEGALMSTGSFTHDLNPGDTVTFVSSIKPVPGFSIQTPIWLLSDINTVGVYGV